VVPGEQRFDEDRGIIAIPRVAHGDTSRTGPNGAAEGFAKVSEWEIGDHEHSERVRAPSAVARGRSALVGPMTAELAGV
jgi:hypothetical protein